MFELGLEDTIEFNETLEPLLVELGVIFEIELDDDGDEMALVLETVELDELVELELVELGKILELDPTVDETVLELAVVETVLLLLLLVVETIVLELVELDEVELGL